MPNRTVIVNDKMQKGYRYALTAPAGRNFDPEFTPDLTPAEMLRLGVFGGKYMTDSKKEFPESWFKSAKLSPTGRDPSLNYFRVDASQPLSEWKKKGWIHPDDPRGRFQWYCASDQTLEGDPAARDADQEELRARRYDLPPPPAPGAAALGL